MAIHSEHEFTVLYRAHYDDVLRYVRRRAADHVVDDVVADTFLTAWRRRADVPDDARPWLFVTARQLLLNARRGQNRQDALAVRIGTADVWNDDGAAAGGAASHGADAVDARIDLVAAWRSLSADDQEILSLTVWEQLPQAEAAAVLGCTRAAFAMRLTRARRRLADLLTVDDTTRPIALAAL